MVYTVLRIDEDMDFGCEERPEDAPVLAVVTLQQDDGFMKIIKVPDAALYEAGIEEYDEVCISSDGTLVKITGEADLKDFEKTEAHLRRKSEEEDARNRAQAEWMQGYLKDLEALDGQGKDDI